eukprot:TRINITY_DN10831_c0_g3_i3.p1 TRINITY_DN10831_c0_g3~~TRINITY_DN10831_c0_g3_i3.p1  ORF type:complete len:113 (+),score=4.01 TRINITY_DN10831_c0_g3_i3:781-1119(+)
MTIGSTSLPLMLSSGSCNFSIDLVRLNSHPCLAYSNFHLCTCYKELRISLSIQLFNEDFDLTFGEEMLLTHRHARAFLWKKLEYLCSSCSHLNLSFVSLYLLLEKLQSILVF